MARGTSRLDMGTIEVRLGGLRRSASSSAFLKSAASSEAQLRRKLPGLFEPVAKPTARPLRGPPKREVAVQTAVRRAAAEEARLGAERATKILNALEKVPWQSEIDAGGDPADEAPDLLYGPELPTGEAAVEWLIGDGREAALMEERVDAVRARVKAMMAADPIDPNRARLPPGQRAAVIVAEVDAAIAANPPTLDSMLNRHGSRRAILKDLVQQEAEARSKLTSFATSAAEIEAEMARFKSEFEMYSQRTPYITQLTTEVADGGEEDAASADEPELGWDLHRRQRPADIEVELQRQAASHAHYAQPSPAAKAAREDFAEVVSSAAAGAGAEAEVKAVSEADDSRAKFIRLSRGAGPRSPPEDRELSGAAEALRAPTSRDVLGNSATSLRPDSQRRDLLPASDVLGAPTAGEADEPVAEHDAAPGSVRLAPDKVLTEVGVPVELHARSFGLEGADAERADGDDFGSEADSGYEDSEGEEEFTAVDIMAAPSPAGRRVA